MSDHTATQPGAPPPAPTLTKWTTGNLTIISADNHVFKVANYHLLSSSSVFREMLSAGSGALRVELTDPAMEDSGTIDHALDFIVNSKFNDRSMKLVVSVALFFKKYDCAAAEANFSFRLEHAHFAPRVKMFVLGAAVDDVDMCSTALKHPLPQWRPPATPTEVKDANTYIHSGCQFDTRTWLICWTAATPISYKWALDRAVFCRPEGVDMVPDFREWLTRAKATEL